MLLGTWSVSAQVTTTIDTTTIRIGEEIMYTIEVEADTTSFVLFPEGQSFAPLEMIQSYVADTSLVNARYRLIKKYGLTQFDSGTYKLPAQRVMVDDRVFVTDSARVEVRDVPVDTTQQKMFDIKPVVEVDKPPFDILPWLYWILPILLTIGIGYLLFRRKKKREERERQLPPYEEAMVALQQLDSSELLIANKSKAYYSSLTEIVKRYIDREVDNTALESTSDELIARLQLIKDAGHYDLDTDTIKKLDAIFKRADLVKFAKMQQESGQARADRSSIEEIINETKEAIPEPTEEELLENEAYAELQAKRLKRKKITRIIGIALLVGATTLAVNIATQGWDAVSDSIFGNKMRDLSEGRWYKSEYGSPAIIIEAPGVLERKDLPVPEEMKQAITGMSLFEFGEISKDIFKVSIMSASYNRELMPETENDLEIALESILSTIETNGGLNMVVKQEAFTTENGIEGLRAYGDYNLKSDTGKIFKEKAAYEIILFKQNQGLQYVAVYYLKDDFIASQMKSRIIDSVELEVDPSQSNNKKEN